MDKIEKTQVSLHDKISKLLHYGFIEARQEVAHSFWQQFEQQHNTLLSSNSEYQEQSEYFLKDIYEQCFDCYLDLKTRMKVNKCQYLKSSLRGEAENLVKQVAVMEVNYDIFWDILNNRYNNKRSILNTYIGKMLNAKRVTTESSQYIHVLLDVTTECLAVLNSIELPTDKWDDIVVYTIIQKLDPESHRLFEQRLESNDKLPTWNDLSQFLDFRFRTLEAVKQQKDTHTREFYHQQRVSPLK
ncbi:hypothetical protein ABMA27_003353 [Loxostege sticticalis]|uniref:Cullin N-terminal domain-containing protein n=1 Tax=Loxostege sticticalis TaxID=481309 RepID=A0ABR3HSU8_LOXSC